MVCTVVLGGIASISTSSKLRPSWDSGIDGAPGRCTAPRSSWSGPYVRWAITIILVSLLFSCYNYRPEPGGPKWQCRSARAASSARSLPGRLARDSPPSPSSATVPREPSGALAGVELPLSGCTWRACAILCGGGDQRGGRTRGREPGQPGHGRAPGPGGPRRPVPTRPRASGRLASVLVPARAGELGEPGRVGARPLAGDRRHRDRVVQHRCSSAAVHGQPRRGVPLPPHE